MVFEGPASYLNVDQKQLINNIVDWARNRNPPIDNVCQYHQFLMIYTIYYIYYIFTVFPGSNINVDQ
jgi:hypothetical protein